MQEAMMSECMAEEVDECEQLSMAAAPMMKAAIMQEDCLMVESAMPTSGLSDKSEATKDLESRLMALESDTFTQEKSKKKEIEKIDMKEEKKK